MWPADQAWRAPVGDFPPPWASAWGDDPYGLWADLTVNGVSQRMRWIEPSGAEGFLMGSTKEERDAIDDADFRKWANERESEPTKVVISQGFWLADTPCTQAFWWAVVGENPSEFKDQPDSAQRPVEQVTLDDVEKFFLRFAATPEWRCGVRVGLPTEAQWEYAARAGSVEAYWWGRQANSTLANWNAEQGGTTPVKRYPSNPWGLFDVHGNVWELCDDTWKPRPFDPSSGAHQTETVVRGGSWYYRSAAARCAYRGWRKFNASARTVGFRFRITQADACSP